MTPTNLMKLALDQQLMASLFSRKLDNNLSVHGISFTEFQIMDQLAKVHPQATSRILLAQSIALSASGITRLLAPMEKNNLIDKTSNPRDARQSLVVLSETGLEVYGQARTTVEFCCEEAYGLLSREQLVSLSGIGQLVKV
ncbi:MarR family transcriptional regulator [Alginatibacterium sediminis]|uniref:MarR family transcriptional regulator n=1 Tax=Alginatibacterium sediminis TaxID=2164068 RepID=A0A420EGW4_9ALTE|nr:MarR family transcriptional regulator [Alginatibacterium sediminis]RKF19904.1 MarR family transcriptional regulator [Alginatibacterium sediminis]